MHSTQLYNLPIASVNSLDISMNQLVLNDDIQESLCEKVKIKWTEMKPGRRADKKLDAEKRSKLKAQNSLLVQSDDDLTQNVSNTATMDQDPSRVDTTAMARKKYEEKHAEYVETRLSFSNVFDFLMEKILASESKQPRREGLRPRKNGKPRDWQKVLDRGWVDAMNLIPPVLQD